MRTTPLHQFVATHRAEIIGLCRTTAATRSDSRPKAEINHGVPVFLDQLLNVLRLGLATSLEIRRSALLHGHDLRMLGFSMSEVVHDYGDVCQSITGLAVETETAISAADFRTLNRSLDDAIASAVTAYSSDAHPSPTGEATSGYERASVSACELRDLSQTALLAFEVLKTGRVGVAGSTGAVLYRSLLGIGPLISRMVTEVRGADLRPGPSLSRIRSKSS